jgi:FMN phosphatase YigB (HAD superfamily)
VEKGVQQVLEALRSGKIKDYKDAMYSNVKFLKEQGIYLLTNNESSWALNLLNEESMGDLYQSAVVPGK